MSLENYTTTGNILPIGLLVCGSCKDKHLKGVDFSNSQVYQPDAPSSSSSANLEISIGKSVSNGQSTGGISITPICPAVGSSTTENGHASPRIVDKPPVTIQPVAHRGNISTVVIKILYLICVI